MWLTKLRAGVTGSARNVQLVHAHIVEVDFNHVRRPFHSVNMETISHLLRVVISGPVRSALVAFSVVGRRNNTTVALAKLETFTLSSLK